MSILSIFKPRNGERIDTIYHAIFKDGKWKEISTEEWEARKKKEKELSFLQNKIWKKQLEEEAMET
jgi:hypothetical protein